MTLIFAVIGLAGCGTGGRPVSDDQAASGTSLYPSLGPAAMPPAAETSATVTPNLSGLPATINPGSIAKWARDVNADDQAVLERKCWTFPASYIRERYLGDRQRLASVMAEQPGGAQTGAVWGTFNSDNVLVTWAEGRSDYACPKVNLSGLPDITDDIVAHRVKRFILREQGRPINSNDVEANYPMRCDYDKGTVSNVARADAQAVTVRATQTGASPAWGVAAGPVTFQVHVNNGEACIVSAS